MTKKPETVKQEDPIKRKDGLYYKENERVPLTGVEERFYENGQLRYKANLKDGKPEGLWEYYFDTGQLETKRNFKNGKIDGLHEEYYENGQLRCKENYKDGQIIDQLVETFYDDGRLSSRENYKDGHTHGISEFYDSDRRKKSNSKRLENKWNFKKGKMYGICESFYPEGDQIIFLRSTYQDGKRIEERTFHRNGLLESKTIGEHPNYTKKYYDGNGKFTSKFMVKDGKYFYFKGGWKDKFRLWLWSLKHVIVMTNL